MNLVWICIAIVILIADFIAGTLYGKNLAFNILDEADKMEVRLRNLIG